ncbi:hypothetical protein BQ8794_50089 [Mesorhizobium prunaredense]|uniref:Uncharacterized protein n=1 Tax=Mesorhizobium prunaredense TaxID=1631249 RepID=A0A1R3VHU3_9HYPH|nr:hypothetical protein BQ8794_50089 [Mesorhizobium prunaredense]
MQGIAIASVKGSSQPAEWSSAFLDGGGIVNYPAGGRSKFHG